MTVNLPSKTERLGLQFVGGPDEHKRLLDIVFVHGLSGDAWTTWMSDPDNSESFWPAWLLQEQLGIGVWTVGYSADPSRWTGESMPIADQGVNLLNALESDGIGKRPIIFVTHSLGGILVKQLLQKAEGFGVSRWKPIAENTRGVVFLGTPHSGANLANFITFIGTVLRVSDQVKGLQSHHHQLLELNNWFRAFHSRHQLAIRRFCETREVQPNIPFLGIRLPKGIVVVDQTSAEPNITGEVAVPLFEDHLTICKPPSLKSDVYRSTVSLIKEIVKRFDNQPSAPELREFVAQPDGKVTRNDNVDAKSESRTSSRIACLELTLNQPFETFDEIAFLKAFARLGVDVTKVRISSIRKGSVIVQIKGTSEALESAVKLLQSRGIEFDLFARETEFRSMVVEATDPRTVEAVIESKDVLPVAAGNQIFISYSHKDHKWRDTLEMHLKPFLNNTPIISWSDKQIAPGQKWLDQIKMAISKTRVAVLLVTPRFLASEFIINQELNEFLRKAETAGLKLLWIPVEACAFHETPLMDYQSIIPPDSPLASITAQKRAKVWVNICEKIRDAANPP